MYFLLCLPHIYVLLYLFLSLASSVSALQESLAHQLKVTSKDVILLTGKGQLLETHEILGQYDGGTVR